MGACKTFALAGALVMGATAVATGADMPPPPMPAYPVAPLRGSIDASGIYLRGDVGMGSMGDAKASYQNLGSFTPTSLTYQNGSMGNVGFFGLGVGYQFNSWLRFDVTGELRGTAKLDFNDKWTTPTLTGTNSVRGHLNSSVFLANAYVDLGNWHGLTPFLGAGAGVVYHKVSRLDDSGTNSPNPQTAPPTINLSSGSFDGKSKTNFAWALMAGVAYDVTQNVKLELGYRYLNMGKAESGTACAFSCPPNSYVRFRDIQSHDIKFGVRWLLGGPEYAPPPATPIVVRKG